MSTDYEKGFRGEPGVNNSEYQRGVQDSSGMFNPHPGGEPSTSSLPKPNTGPGALGQGIYDAAVGMGKAWRKNPDRTLKGILAMIVGFTVLGMVLGFLAGNVLHDEGLWLSYTKVFFFLGCVVYVPMIFGATIGGRPTARGCLTIVFFGGLAGFLMWTYALYPAIFIHIK